MDEVTSFGSWIALRRRALRLTQDELGQLVGCSAVMVRKIESDARRPSLSLAARLAAHLGLSQEQRATFVQVARARRPADWLGEPKIVADGRGATRLARRNALPTPLTSLLGREADIAAACSLLHGAGARLLTLVGPPGIGKTRLALQMAAELQDEYPDGAVFVDLAPISDAGLVAPTIAKQYGLREHDGQPIDDMLKRYLYAKRMLLVLDNFEHVLAAAPLIADLLVAAPQLKLLVTSRTVLRLSGERTFAVPPLALPAPKADQPMANGDNASPVSAAAISRYAAVRLFVERAQAARPEFAVTDENALAVAEICRRLDGLPLAIELAAARLKLFSAHALLARLNDQLALLTGGPRDLPPRQQTIRNTIDWSYRLLEPAEQRLFARLGVFMGGCTLAAAEAVCRVGGEQPIEIADGIAALVDQSLVGQAYGVAGEPRFTMLETIREYALERLEACGEEQLLRHQHAAYLLSLAKPAGAGFSGADQVTRLGRMEEERANLQATLQWATERGATELGVRLALAWEWLWRSHVIEGRAWFEAFLRQRGALSLALQMQLLRQAGGLAGDYPRAQALLAESLALARQLGDKHGIATALRFLGFAATAQGHYQDALKLLEESRALSHELGDTMTTAATLIHLGELMALQGDYARAVALCQESWTLARERNHTLIVGWALYALGSLAQRQGDAGQARALLAESLPVFQEAGDMEGIAAYLETMAEVAGIEDHPERLVRLFGAAVSLHIRLDGSPYSSQQAEHERQLLTARAELGEKAFAAAWEAGRAMPLEQAVAEARLRRDV